MKRNKKNLSEREVKFT